MPMSNIEKIYAGEKVQKALRAIQDAQNLIALACRELCSAPGIGESYGATCRLHDQVKAHWHSVHDAAQSKGFKV